MDLKHKEISFSHNLNLAFRSPFVGIFLFIIKAFNQTGDTLASKSCRLNQDVAAAVPSLGKTQYYDRFFLTTRFQKF